MMPHLVIVFAVLPLQLALGWWNNRRGMLDGSEVGFWGMVIFLAAEIFYLGAIR